MPFLLYVFVFIFIFFFLLFFFFYIFCFFFFFLFFFFFFLLLFDSSSPFSRLSYLSLFFLNKSLSAFASVYAFLTLWPCSTISFICLGNCSSLTCMFSSSISSSFSLLFDFKTTN